MKRKPAPRKLNTIRKPSKILTLEYEGTRLNVYSDGILTIQGETKHAAYALAKQLLEHRDNLNSFMITSNDCIKYSCEQGKKWTIKWVGKGILEKDIMPKPFFWDEFKTEFERFCELKIFS